MVKYKNIKCKSCTRKRCKPACFDAHPGSIIALKKATKGKNILLAEE